MISEQIEKSISDAIYETLDLINLAEENQPVNGWKSLEHFMGRLMLMSMNDIEKRFTYHKPKEDQTSRYEEIRQNCKITAKVIETLCPNSREKSLAMTKLEEAVMWANAAIARNE